MSCRALPAVALLVLASALTSRAEESALRREVMENGAVVLVKEDHNMPVATLQAWFPVGSITEGENLGQGLSHYVEHMIFKGTAKQKPGDFARTVRAAGGDLNAYTSFDRTVFHCTFRSEFFGTVLEAFSDVIMNSAMDPEEARKEQQVIVNELKMYLDDPNRLIQYAYNETAWHVHPARHPIGGYLDQFLKLKPEDVGNYFRKWYAPNNSVLIVVGDVDGAATVAAMKKAFGGWERKPISPIVLPEEPPQQGMRREQRTYPVQNGTGSGARLKMGWQGMTARDDDAPALDMASLLLGHGESSRLARVLKNEKRLVQSIYSGNDTPGYRGHFAIGATLEPGSLAEAEKEILAQVERIRTEKVSDEELGRVKAAIVTYNVLSRQEVESQANDLGSGELNFGNPDIDRLYLEKLKAVTADDVLRVAKKYLVMETLTVASVVPQAAGTGEHGTDGAAKAAFEPRIEELTLTNGMRVVVRNNPNSHAFGLSIAFMAGSRLEPADKPGVANLTAEMLMRGTKSRSAAQLAEDINRTGGTIKLQGGRNTLLVSAEMVTDRFDEALALIADMLFNPAFDARELDSARRLIKFQLERMQRDAGGATSMRFHRMMYGDHPYGRVPQGTAESLDKLTPDDLRAFLAQFIHPGNCVVAVVGDLKADQVKAALDKAFGAWKPRTEPLPTVKPPALLEKGMKDDVEDPTKNMGVAMIGFQTVTMSDEDRWPLQVLDSILGGMGGRLWDEVREKRNLAYSVWGASVTMYERGYFQFGVMAQADNLDAALKTILDEVKKVSVEGVTDDELLQARNKVIGDNLVSLQKNSSQAQALALDTIYGLGPRNLFEIPKKIDKVTVDDLKRVAKKYFDPDKAVVAITRPAAK